MNTARFKRTNFSRASLKPTAAILVAWSLVLVAITAAVSVLLQQQPVQAQASSASPSYAVTHLGQDGLGGYYTERWSDINDAGHVVVADYDALLYKDGQFYNLGTLEGDQIARAQGINNADEVVGYSEQIAFCTGQKEWFDIGLNDAPCDPRRRAFIYKDGQGMTDLGTLPGGKYSEAREINDAGQVVGSSQVLEAGNYPWRAFLYKDGQGMTELGTLGGSSSTANDINDAGQVVGNADTSSGAKYAFLYKDGQGMTNLGSFGGPLSVAHGINNAGEVVGHAAYSFISTTDMRVHAFIYKNHEMTDLGTLGGTPSISSASDINDASQVVGWSITEGGAPHAFLYENGQMTDLNTLIPADSGWVLKAATAINKQGQITGVGRKEGQSEWEIFLLTPPDTTPSALSVPADITKEATGANGTAVEFKATATDDMDGALPDSSISYKTDSGTVASGDTFPLGTTTVTVTATDKAGNTATATFKITVVDTTPPVISGMPSDTKVTATSAQGATVTYIAPTTAKDLVDGNVPVQCSPTSGSAFLLGDTIVTCTSTDKRGNRATATFKVSVVYAFGSGSGGSFGEPVKATELNQLAAGASVPVKFGLGGDYGLNIFAAGYPTSKQIICPNGLPPDVVEETSTATKSGLTYDATSGLYTYVWKTDRAWKGTCRELNLKLADGSDHKVQFQFT